ncbi:hypothetical protein RE428_25880 [Marinobacter nanhaiticus D15-8W]|uniref:DUF2970 domain-containing protein n=1 Tax=Marinobacter nanhaiticus D15-8W TaxID=626887 RepID=N6VVI0_9GAMM|nr:DUF2970 domain-containing protein [Marinobacter nanhaiticus]ENO14185.1 DUF2970 domain-containing protein [Marinobacter nanhaiticus D15-8W]BES71570.1 hypothetical protein RE428_25880 [Marinobacter nanhaiticus D15-8W]
MNKPEHNDAARPEGRPRRPGVFKVIQSILAGAFGVQSDRRREEDFSSGSPLTYIVAGIVFVLVFVVTIALVVQWVISTHS